MTASIRSRSQAPLALAVTLIVAVVAIVHRWVPAASVSELLAWGISLIWLARHVGNEQRVPAHLSMTGAALILGALLAAADGELTFSWFAAAAACVVLVLPAPAPAAATLADRRRTWALVDRTVGDTLAPFALRTDKSVIFTDDGRAAQAYRVRFGTAVASGDPVGDADAREQAIDKFRSHAAANGWRVAALAVGPEVAALWRKRGFSGVAIGRDVRVDVATFSMQGRRFRNLRQSVQHTHNAGVTTQIVQESELDAATRSGLLNVLQKAPAGLRPRGFAMILDRPLTSDIPGTWLAIARDRSGRLCACQRYGTAHGGREVSFDLPWRLGDAPNGTEERLIVDVIGWARARGATHVSLSFAAFPELFEAGEKRSFRQRIVYWLVRQLDRFITLDSHYRFLRKFHALGDTRHVMLQYRNLLPTLVAALSLEFTRVDVPRIEK